MKKVLSLLTAFALAATMLVGCGGTEAPASAGAEGSEAAAPAASGDKVELTYWSMWNSTEGQAKVIQEAADAYEKATGVHINIEWKGRDVKTLIGPALDAGQKVDFFDTDADMLVKQNGKYLADLTEMANAAEYQKHVMPVLLDNVLKNGDGKLMAMPYQPFTTGVWYDKDMFAAAGVTEEEAVPKTFNDLLTLCEKVKASGVNPMTCNSDGVGLLYGYQLARYVGQDKVDELRDNVTWKESPEALKAAQDIYTLFEKGYMSEHAPANYPEGQNEIGFEESAMILNASWVPNEIIQNTGKAVNWGFFPWPEVEGGVDGIEASMVGSQGFGIVDKSEHKQEAFDFLMTVVTGEYDLKMSETVISIPADVENTQWPAVVAGAEPYFKNMTKTYAWNVGLSNNADYDAFIQDAMVKLCKMDSTPEQFIDELAAMK